MEWIVVGAVALFDLAVVVLFRAHVLLGRARKLRRSASPPLPYALGAVRSYVELPDHDRVQLDTLVRISAVVDPTQPERSLGVTYAMPGERADVEPSWPPGSWIVTEWSDVPGGAPPLRFPASSE